MQCEVKLAQKRGRLESNLSSTASDEEEGDDGGDSDSDDESSAKARYFSYVKQGLYYVTEMERFAPPRKRPRAVTKNYRLVSLRSTTPEELYQRKVGGHRRLGGTQTVNPFGKKTCDYSTVTTQQCSGMPAEHYSQSFQWLTAFLVSVTLKRIHITAPV